MENDCLSIIISMLLLLAVVIVFLQNRDMFSISKRSHLTPSPDNTGPSCNAFKYCDCPTDLDGDCQQYLSHINQGTNKNYCRRLQAAEVPCTCMPSDYTSIVGNPLSNFKSHATVSPSTGPSHYNALKFCDCPPDIDGECSSYDNSYKSKESGKYCRRLQAAEVPCTCMPSDYTSIVGTSNFKSHATVSPSTGSSQSYKYDNPILQQDNTCNLKRCHCPRLPDKTCPENWTPMVNNVNTQLCEQVQNIGTGGCNCLKESMSNSRHTCSCSANIPSCGCSD